MNAHDHNARINPGSNSWLVTRTDRDACDAGDAIASVGAPLNRWLNNASPAGFRGIFQTLHTSHTGGRFVVGAARPIFVTVARERPAVPDGLVLVGKSEDSPFSRRVRAVRPWFLSVVFEWHGGVTYIPWPNHFAPPIGSSSVSDMDLDWLLLETHEAKMSTVPAAVRGLVFDPGHESPDVIDERPPNDPTRAQTAGGAPVLVTPGDPQAVLTADDASVPLFNGWNVWDVYQSLAPIDPTPGTLDDQLASFVRDAAGLDATHPIAKVSSAAAGTLVKARSSIPALAGPLELGVGTSAIRKTTVAFENDGPRSAAAWPHSMNALLDAVYLPAGAPVVPAPATNPPALPIAQASSSAPLMLALGAGLTVVLLMRGKGRR